MTSKHFCTRYLITAATLLNLTALAQTSPKAMPAAINNITWAPGELTEPAQLAAASYGTLPLILNIGAVEDIRGAKHIGPVSDAANMEKLKTLIEGVSKEKAVVIYCGCCPFARCPNVKPAFQELKRLGYTNVKILDLPVNLRTNWIEKGYPLAETQR